MATLALLDGHSLAYRAFYALPSDLATPSGQVTNAVFGFTSMLIKLLGEERPDAVLVTWDVRGPQFRKDLFPEYKAQRESPPDLFRSQLPLIHEVLEALGIRQIEAPGYEADDVIATLATRAKGEGWQVLVVTGDRDAFQLVDDDIAVLYTRRGISDTVTADAAWVQERYGIPPTQYRDYAALRGDPSDNLPGVPGVGEKTAERLVATYGSLEGIYEHLDDLTPKLVENLAAHHDQVFLNRQIMELVYDVPIGDVDLAAAEVSGWDPDRVKTVFDGLAFRILWERLLEIGGQAPVETDEIEVEVVVASDPSDLTVSDGLLVVEPVRQGGELLGLVIDGGTGPASYVPVDDLGLLDPHLDAGVRLASHDVKGVLRQLLDSDGAVATAGFDTALAAYLINPAQRTPDLEELALRQLGLTLDAASGEQAATSQGAFDFDGTGPDLEAAGRRAVATARLIGPLREQLAARGGTELYEEIELPLVPVLARMEHTGVGVDRPFLEQLSIDLRDRLGVLEGEIHEAAGGPFNVNSTLQLREILYDRLSLPVLKKTPKGVPSTDASVLEKLRTEHPVVDHLLRFRELEKLRSTYVDAMLPLIEADGRVRGRFNQMAASTGRLSQEQPNLQNIPVRSEEGRIIRRAFVSAPGHTLLVADYSQIELRILAHLSGDAGLVEAFANDVDIHTATAARIAGVPLEDVTKEMRRRAKVVNFGLLYGMEAYGLAQRLEVSREEAGHQMEAYFEQFPEVRAFMQGIVDEARQAGYTTTLLGRRRYLPELSSSNFRDRQMGERMALNAPIQGSAADIIKKAMVVLDHRLRKNGSAAEMLLQIHDELVLEVPDDEVDEVSALTCEVMEGIVDLRVPLRIDAGTGPNLADAKG